jgi:glycosyltransferase involved in cell wall biosynthesis
MVENILADKQIRVALLSPGEWRQTAITHSQVTFARVMSHLVRMDYVSEAAGEYRGITFKPIDRFNPEDYDVLHFQWGNNPLHFFEFSTLLKLGSSRTRPLIVSTLHEADLGYTVGASDKASRYRWYFKLKRGRKDHRDLGSAYDLERLGSDYNCFSYYTVAEILQRSDWVIVNSEYTKRLVVERHSLSNAEAAKIRAARLGIDWNDWDSDGRNDQPQRSGQPTSLTDTTIFLYVGSLHPTKSVDKVIRALHYVGHFGRREDFDLVVVGTGPEYDRLHDLAETLIPGRYQFTQFVPSVAPYYHLADVVLCPRSFCRGEISASIPEACAAGKPVILPGLGGWGEYIDESRGYVLPKDDELEYAEAIFECLENPDRVKRQGQNARRYAEECLSWQAQAKFFLSIYSSYRW